MNNAKINLDYSFRNFEKIENELDDVYKDGKRGYYKLIKQEGVNTDIYNIDHVEYGVSRGIVLGYGVLVTTPTRYFITSPVNQIIWDDNNSGSFKTKNSTYKFTYKPINNENTSNQ